MNKKKSVDSSSKPVREPTEFSVASSRASSRAARTVPPVTTTQVQRDRPRYDYQDEEGDKKPPATPPSSSLKKVANPTSTDDNEVIAAVSNYYLQSAGCIDKELNESHDRAMEKEDLKIKQAAAAPPTRGQNENEGDKKPLAMSPFSPLTKVANPASSLSPRFPDEGITKKDTPRGLAMASGTPAYQPRRAAVDDYDENLNYNDIEAAIDSAEPPTITTQAPPTLPGAYREGGGFEDDEETLLAAPEQNTLPPNPSSTLDNVIAEARLVDETSLVVADIAHEKWWSKRRNVSILIAAIVILLLGVLGAVVGTLVGGGGGGGGDNVAEQDNSVCSNAIELSIPSSVDGSTILATLDDVGEGTPCGPDAPGVWYTVVGTGNNIIASTCNGDNSYNTAISVFRGGCSDLQCVVRSGNGSSLASCVSEFGSGSRAVWASVRGETYSVLVHGLFEVGDFRVDISESDAENDVCEDATPLSIPSTIEGSTMNATLDDVGADTPCEPDAPGVWYTVVGTGNNIIASTCNEVTSYDTAILVFRGGCDGLQCVSIAALTETPSETPTSSSATPTRTMAPSASPSATPLPIDTPTMAPTFPPSATPLPTDTMAPSPSPSAGPTAAPSLSARLLGRPSKSPLSTDTSDPTAAPSIFPPASFSSVSKDPRSCSTICWTSVHGETYSVLVHGVDREVGDFRFDIDAADNDCEGQTQPSINPTDSPAPTASPSFHPTTASPSFHPTITPRPTGPSINPTDSPAPTASPSFHPTVTPRPTEPPSPSPSDFPSQVPSIAPSTHPTFENAIIAKQFVGQRFKVGNNRIFNEEEQISFQSLLENYTQFLGNDSSRVTTICNIRSQELFGGVTRGLRFEGWRGRKLQIDPQNQVGYFMTYQSRSVNVTNYPVMFLNFINANLEMLTNDLQDLGLNVTESLDALLPPF